MHLCRNQLFLWLPHKSPTKGPLADLVVIVRLVFHRALVAMATLIGELQQFALTHEFIYSKRGWHRTIRETFPSVQKAQDGEESIGGYDGYPFSASACSVAHFAFCPDWCVN